jgi:hypothetical protein
VILIGVFFDGGYNGFVMTLWSYFRVSSGKDRGTCWSGHSFASTPVLPLSSRRPAGYQAPGSRLENSKEFHERRGDFNTGSRCSGISDRG